MNEATPGRPHQHGTTLKLIGSGRRRLTVALVTAGSLAVSPDAHAHSEVRPTPDTLWLVWEPEPLIAVALLLTSWLYLRGTAEIWRRAGSGRGVRRWHVYVFFAGVISFALVSLSPLDALGGALFSAHMVQHLVLFLAAPMLFAASRPLLPMIWSMPQPLRHALLGWLRPRGAARAAWHVINHWIPVLLLYAAVLWLWHVPSLYNAALKSNLVHGIEHISFMVLAFMFWSAVLNAGRPEGVGHGVALLMIFVTALHGNALGAGLTFADVTLYTSHEAHTRAWGLTPLEDQQLAGVVMWIPVGIWLTGVALALVGFWIRAADQSVRKLEADGAEIAGEPGTATVAVLPHQPIARGRS